MTREEFQAKANQIPTVQEVDVPDFGKVHVRRMKGFERDKWEAACIKADGKANMDNFRARLVTACLCDDKGNRLYQDGEIGIVGMLDAVPLTEIYLAARKLNRLTKEDIEELAKNSVAGQSAGSGSNSATATEPLSLNSKN